MKTSGMGLAGYLSFSWKYMLCVFATGIVMLIIVQSGIMEQVSFNPLGVIALAATFIAGWNVAKKKLGIKQAAVVGAFCFLAIAWLVPINVLHYMEQLGVPQTAIEANLAAVCIQNGAVNFAIYEAIVIAGYLTGSRMARTKKA